MIERWRFGEVNKFIVNVTSVGFGGTAGQPKIHLSIDCSEDAGNEGGIVGGLGLVGNEICRNLWLPRVKAHGKLGCLTEEEGSG